MKEFPSYVSFREVCRAGLSAVRPLISERAPDPHGWNYGCARVPSYEAYGRMRALFALELARSLRPRRVPEVAAGDGALCASLQRALGCEVWANDLRADNLKDALNSFTNGASIGQAPGNLFELGPERIGQFDLVMACEVIEHVAHTGHFLTQLRRFVSPGGRLLLTTPNGSYFRNTLPTHAEVRDFGALESIQFKPDADGHLFLITPKELADLSAQAGFKVERIDLWGTPAITGYAGLRMFGRLGWVWPWYAFEFAFLGAPMAVREKFSYALSAVLRLSGPASDTQATDPRPPA